MPAVGQARVDERRQLRRRSRAALIAIPFWVALAVLDVLVRHRFDVNALLQPLVLLGVLAGGTVTTRRAIRRHAAAVEAIPPDPAGQDWAGPASLSPDGAWELRTGGTEPAVGRLSVRPYRLNWVPDADSASGGHRGWELAPRDVLEAEVAGGRRTGRLRLVRPGRAIAVTLGVDSTEHLSDALRGAGFTVAD